ncbi:MAG: PRC-barrel domain-containing protein [Solirubrobacterales bacterium]
MKKSQEIIGLPVFSIVDGKEVGQVKDLVVNPEEGAIDFLLVNGGNWYVGARVLPFRAVLGIGQHAVTTESESNLTNLNESASANAMLQRGIKVKGTKVLTRKGNLVGVVAEYDLDENTGKVNSLELKGLEEVTAPGTLTAAHVLTFGKDVLVIDERALGGGPDKTPERPAPVEVPTPAAAPIAPAAAPAAKESDAARLFVERQKQFLLGKKVTRDVKDDQGNLLIAEGTIVDDGVLEIAEATGKMVELSQNAK